MIHTDIKREGWITRLPLKWQAYAILMRLDRPIGWWLLLLPSWWGIIVGTGGIFQVDSRTIYLMSLFWLGAILMRGAGCIINDLWDRELDRQVERTKSRPIASREISIRKAMVFLSILLVVSFLILIQLPIISGVLGIFSIILVIAYPLMKRITWWPQAFLGITFNFGALMGYSAVAGVLNIEALLLYTAGIFWTLGYDTIYALQDKEDDALVGIKSTARLFNNNAPQWVGRFYVATTALLFIVITITGANIMAYAMLCLVAYYFYWQVTTLKLCDSKNALQRFKNNRDVGILICLMLLLTVV